MAKYGQTHALFCLGKKPFKKLKVEFRPLDMDNRTVELYMCRLKIQMLCFSAVTKLFVLVLACILSPCAL